MSFNYERADFGGRVTRVSEIKVLGGGREVLNFSLAVSENWKDANGEKKEKTKFIEVAVWGKADQASSYAKTASRIAKKGAVLLVEGKVDAGHYIDKKDGSVKNQLRMEGTKITVVEWAKDDAEAAPTPGSPAPSTEQVADDDIPF